MRCPAPEELLAYAEAGAEAVSPTQARHISTCGTCATRLRELRETAEILQRSACPSSEELVGFAAGDSADDRSHQLTRHLATCPSCRQLLDDARGLLSSPAEPPDAEDARLVERAQRRFRAVVVHSDLLARIRQRAAEILDQLQGLASRRPGLSTAEGPAAYQSLEASIPRPALELRSAAPADHSRRAEAQPPTEAATPRELLLLAEHVWSLASEYEQQRHGLLDQIAANQQQRDELLARMSAVEQQRTALQARIHTSEQQSRELLALAQEALSLWERYAAEAREAQGIAEREIDRLRAALHRLRE